MLPVTCYECNKIQILGKKPKTEWCIMKAEPRTHLWLSVLAQKYNEDNPQKNPKGHYYEGDVDDHIGLVHHRLHFVCRLGINLHTLRKHNQGSMEQTQCDIQVQRGLG